jgi:hypothetical protein
VGAFVTGEGEAVSPEAVLLKQELLLDARRRAGAAALEA